MNIVAAFLVGAIGAFVGLVLYALMRVSGMCDDGEERWNR